MKRKAQVGICPRCSAVVLAGLDGDVAAFGVRVAPERLAPIGEALALASGMQTYEMHYGNQLSLRETPGEIARRPAGPHFVHAEHKCGFSIPRHWCAPIEKDRITEFGPQPPLRPNLRKRCWALALTCPAPTVVVTAHGGWCEAHRPAPRTPASPRPGRSQVDPWPTELAQAVGVVAQVGGAIVREHLPYGEAS